jgi:hypothetical protein
LRERFAPALPATTGLLRRDRRLEHRDDDNSRAKELEEVAPIQIKVVRCRCPEFITFWFQRNLFAILALIVPLLSRRLELVPSQLSEWPG